jgi:hypothetical protein
MHHHLMLTKQYLEPDAIPNHRGVISNHCDVYECAQRAFEAVRRICLQKYGCAPTLLIERGPDRPMRYVEVCFARRKRLFHETLALCMV